ncbi:radical SAM protein [Klebsiella variicola subsp. variicola]|nr:radical SAM protein [Klebsiella variicola subsp. variicola]
MRTVVFFKGCPHTCPWCANPESISPRIQTLRRESKCLRCTRCQQDVAECPSGAWEQIGRDVTLDNLLQEVLKDEVFFQRLRRRRHTLSGASAHAGRVCRPLSPAPAPVGIRTAIETAGDGAFDRFLPVAEACNEVLFDFKIMEPERARSLLRMNQPRVLDNFASWRRENQPDPAGAADPGLHTEYR